MATSKKNTEGEQAPVSAPTLDDIIGNASPVERIVRVCVAGHLSGEYERIRSEIDEASSVQWERLSGGGSNLPALQRKLEETAEEMRKHTYSFRFQAVSAKKWSDLIAAHPDKDGKRIFDPETFPAAAISATCVEPAGMDDAVQAGKLLEKLSPAQQAELFDGAWQVNTNAPKGLS